MRCKPEDAFIKRISRITAAVPIPFKRISREEQAQDLGEREQLADR